MEPTRRCSHTVRVSTRMSGCVNPDLRGQKASHISAEPDSREAG